jgi:hypothetical protein
MKNLIVTFVMTLVSTAALAHTGSHTLTCKSAAKSGSKQIVQFSLRRSNSEKTYHPEYSITINGKKFEFATEDDDRNYGETFHNSPLGVITVTADNYYDENSANTALFSITAIPGTVKAYDTDGKLVKWNLKQEQEEDYCYDRNGKATFKGLLKGSLNTGDKSVPVDTQIMDCELSYNSGMAC